MTRARREIINPSDTPYYHCMSRCVRRAFLCGDDDYTGRNYDHRKQWMVNRIKLLSQVFCIDVCAYAVMSNHYHLVLKIDQKHADNLSLDDVISKWCELFKGPLLVQRYLAKEALSKPERDAVSSIVEVWRKRLFDIGWFMRCLNEPLARESNREDRCTGRFWEGRYKSQALLDEGALLSCMAYVDLNPIRAGICSALEDSDFTSIQERLFEHAKRNRQKKSNCNSMLRLVCGEELDSPACSSCLVRFIGDENNSKGDDGIYFSEKDYFELVDWTGRTVREDKRGAIPVSVLPILEKLQLAPEAWLSQVKQFCRPYQRNGSRVGRAA